MGSTKHRKTTNTNEVNATFADLPAPQLHWEEMAKAPVPRLDGAAIQIKNLLYVFAGYGTIDYVSEKPFHKLKLLTFFHECVH